MDLAEIWRVMRRRWYVLLPGLLITAALTAAVYLLVPVEYRSQSTVTLLNSKKATVAFDGNPFLSTQASLTGMADGLARNLNSDDAKADLKSLGVTGVHEAKIADNALGPYMWLSVVGTDRAAVLKSDEILTKYAEKRLLEFQTQQSVTPDAMIRMATIVPPEAGGTDQGQAPVPGHGGRAGLRTQSGGHLLRGGAKAPGGDVRQAPPRPGRGRVTGRIRRR